MIDLFQELGAPTPWAKDALCAQTDPEAFFPEKGGSTLDARRVCANCDVVAECLAYALKNRIHVGVWGGKSPSERARLITAEKSCSRCGNPRTGARYCDECAVIMRQETKKRYEREQRVA